MTTLLFVKHITNLIIILNVTFCDCNNVLHFQLYYITRVLPEYTTSAVNNCTKWDPLILFYLFARGFACFHIHVIFNYCTNERWETIIIISRFTAYYARESMFCERRYRIKKTTLLLITNMEGCVLSATHNEYYNLIMYVQKRMWITSWIK